jgi:hypothetical protein
VDAQNLLFPETNFCYRVAILSAILRIRSSPAALLFF